MTKQEEMRKRFDERFPLLRVYPEKPGELERFVTEDVLTFLQSEIDLALAEREKELVEMIREYAEPYENSKWLNAVNAQKIIALITKEKTCK